MPHILDESSPRLTHVPESLVELKPHQQAILKKTLDMENEYFKHVYDIKTQRQQSQQTHNNQMQAYHEQMKLYEDRYVSTPNPPINPPLPPQVPSPPVLPTISLEPFGVIGSTVGSGKTYCVIAQCLLEKCRKKTQLDKIFSSNTSMATMIVVPSHLYYHWVEAFDRYAGKALNLELFDDYDSVMRLYGDGTEITNAADVFLVSDLYYENVASTLCSLKLSFKRVIFDEIDSIEGALHTTLASGFTWFVSGSFKNHLTSEQKFTLGNIDISTKTLLRNYVGVEDSFVLESFQIPQYEFQSITCDNKVVEGLKHSLTEQALHAINSCDPQTALMKLGMNAVANIPNDKAFADILLKNWEEIIKDTEDYISNQKIKKMKDDQKKTINLQRIEKDIIEKDKYLTHVKTCHETVLYHLKSITNFQPEFPKIVKLFNMIENQKDKKILLYSEFPRVFIELSKLMDTYNIKYCDFEGGNTEEMHKAVKTFKERDDVNIFLAHSTLFSCGMNLENTDVIIFLHRIKPEVMKQVIGRGQRPGRTCPLHVYELIHKNEKMAKF